MHESTSPVLENHSNAALGKLVSLVVFDRQNYEVLDGCSPKVKVWLRNPLNAFLSVDGGWFYIWVEIMSYLYQVNVEVLVE